MSQRGNYRAIHTVLIEGPDYQALPPNAKLVLLTLKLNLGPTGIDVLYTAAVEAQTGLSGNQVRLAMDVLEHSGWVRHERNVVWVVEGLKYEPSRSLRNKNHQDEIRKHLDGLPRLPIVDAFRAFYGLPEPQPEGHAPCHSNGIGDGIPPAMGDHGRTEERKNGVTESVPSEAAGDGDALAGDAIQPPTTGQPSSPLPDRKPPPATDATNPEKAERGGWPATLSAVLKGRGFRYHPAKVGSVLKEAIDEHGPALVSAALESYLDDTPAKYVSLTTFATRVGAIVEDVTPMDQLPAAVRERKMREVAGARR